MKHIKSIYHFVKLLYKNRGLTSYYLQGEAYHLSLNYDKSILTDCVFTIEGKNNKIVIEDGCILTGVWFLIVGDNNTITVGANTYVNSDSRRLTMFSACHATNLSIGKRCLFSNDIEVQTTDHHKILVGGKQTNTPKDIIIGDHCWIGAHTSIMKGAIIPNNCVIGAKSLVNKKFDRENAIIAGHPAKVIKENINWDY